MAVTLSQNEISARAAKFADDWKDTEREEAEAQSFLIEFFHVLGVSRKRVAIFEHRVKCADGGNGYIDLFWKGHILIEMKSRGKDLTKAYEQAKRYADSLAHHEFPKAILVCDFENWHFYDLSKDGQLTSFTLSELPQYIHLFHFLAGYEQREYLEEDPVNVQAAELLGKLHDRLKEIGYVGHPLEVYLVRLLFCLFAEDTGIFRKDAFRSYILDCTQEDGRDLAPLLAELFQVLNTPVKNRLCTRNEAIKEFPYVNGGLFAEFLPMPAFDTAMRQALIDCCSLDWSRISPAIFGSMFQSVMDATARRTLGAHYTSERNILKLNNPLFMDALREEFESIQYDKSNRKEGRLQSFHKKLSELTFLDPACGCGNFLVVAYRELRRLELSVIAEREKMEMQSSGTKWMLSANDVCLVNVNQFYGIEIEEFPAQIAQVAMWLIDHQMNIEAGSYFGEAYARIPLTASATIVCGNALQLDWESVVPKDNLSYIMGNPPFIGYSNQTKEQKKDIEALFVGSKRAGKLDFVAGWYKKAADYTQNTSIQCAFVSTNSITQGEQASTLWQPLIRSGLSINFAHRTFKWSNEARGVAAVHCVIVGFSMYEANSDKLLFAEDGTSQVAKHINSYLTAAQDVFIPVRSTPICPVPEMTTGNRPADGGHLIIEEEDYNSFIAEEPQASPYIKRLLGSMEFINNKKRWCLWLVGLSPALLRLMPKVMERIDLCKQDRLNAPDAGRRKLADRPALFRETKNPNSYIAVPEVSSERRDFIPMDFLNQDTICTNKLYIIPDATLYHFGILTSTMHMAWTRAVCGRLEMRYQYSAKIVYNNFPWPEVTEAQQEKIAELAQGVLDARALYPDSSLADLYDPLTMPPELVAAHRKLDAAVEKAYGRKFADDAERVAFLFEKYYELSTT
ncbi:MAG: hypothetical protein Q4F40_05075 [Akkermansia sp.]|nr:hypothetical protein [Akkermansia sp.]